jgi:hypothetical protein
MAAKTKAGKKSRKYGRRKNKPAQQRYTNEKRWIKNKEKRIAKDNKRKRVWGLSDENI